MGYSGRYHAASLAAVFLALAIGILIGVGLGHNVVSGTTKNLEQSLEAQRHRQSPLRWLIIASWILPPLRLLALVLWFIEHGLRPGRPRGVSAGVERFYARQRMLEGGVRTMGRRFGQLTLVLLGRVLVLIVIALVVLGVAYLLTHLHLGQ